jgi:putative exporter of polyketide antibiotics
MTSTTTSTVERTRPAPSAVERHLGARAVGALLALGVAYIHVKDQGGFPGDKTPTYVGVGYYVLEAVGLLVALGLLAGAGRHTAKAWLLAAAVALGPLAGFVLSRGPGLPGYTDDKGNWTEPLGLVSLVVEAVLLVIAGVVLARSRRPVG